MDSQIDASRDRSDKLNATASRFLTADEERHLITCWQDARDKRALDRIVRAFAPLVARHAHALRKYTDQRDDLIQEGNIALMEAISRFDSERGARFGTYASWWVKARMQDYVLSNRSVVRIPRSREKRACSSRCGTSRQRQFQNGTDDRQGVETVSAALNIPVGDVVRVAALMSGDQAMEAPVPATGMEFGSMLADPAPGPEETVAARQSIDAGRLLLDEAMDDLSDRERKIIKARKTYGSPPDTEGTGRRFRCLDRKGSPDRRLSPDQATRSYRDLIQLSRRSVARFPLLCSNRKVRDRRSGPLLSGAGGD